MGTHALYTPGEIFHIYGLYSAYDYHWQEPFVFKGEAHNFWELVMVVSGNAEIVGGDRTYVLGSGDMICHAPNVFHRIKSTGNSHVLVLSFANTGTLPAMLNDGVFSLSQRDVEEYRALFDLLHPFVRAAIGIPINQESSDVLQHRAREGLARLEAFLHHLAQLDPSASATSRSPAALEYRNLVQLMHEHANQSITVADLASMRHISESYVKKLFHIYAGEGVMTYFARLRTERIKQLLDKQLPLSEITEQLHFSSPSYLSLFFKKQTGITPGKYRSQKE